MMHLKLKGFGLRIKLYIHLLIVFIVIFTINPFHYALGISEKHILVLNSYHHGYSWSDKIVQGIKEILDNDTYQIHIAYMDTYHNSNDGYFYELYHFYKYKFRNKKFDAIIACDNPAFNFLSKYQKDLFPSTPVVFCGVNNFNDSMVKDHNLFTGVVEAINFEKNIDVMLKLHPNTKEIVVLADTTDTGMENKKSLLKVAKKYDDKVSFIFFDDLYISEAVKEIKQLPKNHLVFLMGMLKDDFGKLLSEDKIAKILSKNSHVPIYSAWELFMGHGIVGGMLTCGAYQGKVAGKIVDRIIKGEGAATIPIVKKSPNYYMFDYEQLKRYNIKTKNLPKDSIIINKPVTFYSEHKRLVWGVISFILFLISNIIVLHINILKRKKVEACLLKANKEIEYDLEVARKIQSQHLPRGDEIPRVEIAILYKPMRQVGGDFCKIIPVFNQFEKCINEENYSCSQYCPLTKQEYAIIFGDVIGKGLSASLIMSEIMTSIHFLDRKTENSPSKILQIINEHLFNLGSFDSLHLATAICLKVDMSQGLIYFSNAAHEKLIYINSKADKVETLDGQGMMLGIENNNLLSYQEKIIKINPGDKIIMCSDGIIELENENGQPFGMKRLVEVVQRFKYESASVLKTKIEENVKKFIGKKDYDDDCLLVILHFSDLEDLECRIPANLRLVSCVAQKMASLLTLKGFEKDDIFDVELAVDEAITNAIIHGCKEDERKSIMIKGTLQGDMLTITVTDPGKGYDYHQKTKMDNKIHFEESGRGLQLINFSMDEVNFSNNGASITMTKRLRRKKHDSKLKKDS